MTRIKPQVLFYLSSQLNTPYVMKWKEYFGTYMTQEVCGFKKFQVSLPTYDFKHNHPEGKNIRLDWKSPSNAYSGDR